MILSILKEKDMVYIKENHLYMKVNLYLISPFLSISYPRLFFEGIVSILYWELNDLFIFTNLLLIFVELLFKLVDSVDLLLLLLIN